jgi:hypothetical protein
MPTDEAQPPRSGAGGRVRSSTEERERTAAVLRAAAEAGLLTLDEADERMATCYQTQYRDQLAPLLADLPNQGRHLVPPDPAEEANVQQFRRNSLQELGKHASFALFVGTVLVVIWAIAGAGFFWPAWPLGFLALSVIFHAKHRARRYRWREYAAHNGFGQDWDYDWEARRRQWHAHRRGPWWNEEERMSRSW